MLVYYMYVLSVQIQRLEETVQSTRDKLEESRELLKTNENGQSTPTQTWSSDTNH